MSEVSLDNVREELKGFILPHYYQRFPFFKTFRGVRVLADSPMERMIETLGQVGDELQITSEDTEIVLWREDLKKVPLQLSLHDDYLPILSHLYHVPLSNLQERINSELEKLRNSMPHLNLYRHLFRLCELYITELSDREKVIPRCFSLEAFDATLGHYPHRDKIKDGERVVMGVISLLPMYGNRDPQESYTEGDILYGIDVILEVIKRVSQRTDRRVQLEIHGDFGEYSQWINIKT